MKQKQIFGVLFAIGILVALTGATLMWFGIAPLPLRIAILIVGTSFIALSNSIEKPKNI